MPFNIKLENPKKLLNTQICEVTFVPLDMNHYHDYSSFIRYMIFQLRLFQELLYNIEDYLYNFIPF